MTQPQAAAKPCQQEEWEKYRKQYKQTNAREIRQTNSPIPKRGNPDNLWETEDNQKGMCMSNDVGNILRPTKKNIRYDVSDENFEWLIKLMDMHETDTPKITVFFRRV